MSGVLGTRVGGKVGAGRAVATYRRAAAKGTNPALARSRTPPPDTHTRNTHACTHAQVSAEAQSIAQHCGDVVRVTSLGRDGPTAAQRAAVTTAGQVVVATPGRVAQALVDGSLSAGVLAGRLHTLVMDEADLLLSYGYEEDLRALAPQVPRSCQCLLMSATSSEDVQRLTKLVLHSPATLSLLGAVAGAGAGAAAGDVSGAAAEIRHCALHCERNDRLLYTLALLKLGLVRCVLGSRVGRACVPRCVVSSGGSSGGFKRGRRWWRPRHWLAGVYALPSCIC